MFRHSKTLLTRAALFAASFTTTALLMAGLGTAFHGASSEPWLRDSPALQQMLARCDARPSHTARLACARDGIARARLGLPPDAHLASAAGLGDAAPAR